MTTHHNSRTSAPSRTTLPARVTFLALAAAALALALVSSLALASPAAAASYRYWGYFQGATGTWEFAQTGPDDYKVVDQDVQGYRFGISSETSTPKPDNAPDFATLCPSLAATPAPAGQLRVAVVIDSGFAADAPTGQTPPADTIGCVTVPSGSTGTQALTATATVGQTNGLVCSINGYPTEECGAAVSDEDAAAAATASATESANPATPVSAEAPSAAPTDTSPGSSAVPFLVGGAVVVILLVVLIVASRRKRAAADAD